MKQDIHMITLCLAVIISAVWIIVPSDQVRAGGTGLRPPFDGTYRVVSYFDHDEPSYASGENGYIWIYNGEQVPASYPNKTGEPYPYDGHDGWDWSMNNGTNILAAAKGIVVVSQDNLGCYGHTIILEHSNGYYTMYSHLSQRLVGEGTLITAGQHIGESGNSVGPGCGAVGAHLHFGVRHGSHANTTYAVDPFGWRGYGRDPLFDFNQKESTCLWRSYDSDPISCMDTVVEDAAGGSVAFPAENWQTSNRGNGYHTYYRSNTTEPHDYHSWSTSAISHTLHPGPCKVYAFIPEDPDGSGTGLAFTGQVTYTIWTVEGWETVRASPDGYNTEWLLLGTFQIPEQTDAGLWAQTNEEAGPVG